jgi:hypothetical protein
MAAAALFIGAVVHCMTAAAISRGAVARFTGAAAESMGAVAESMDAITCSMAAVGSAVGSGCKSAGEAPVSYLAPQTVEKLSQEGPFYRINTALPPFFNVFYELLKQ